jgi:hypothetical protein
MTYTVPLKDKVEGKLTQKADIRKDSALFLDLGRKPSHRKHYNIDLHLSFVPSQQNIADGPSRKLSAADAMLSEMAWSKVENCFGPHSVVK